MALSRRTGGVLRRRGCGGSDCRRGARPVRSMSGLTECRAGPECGRRGRARPERRRDDARRGGRGEGIRLGRVSGKGAPFLGSGNQDRGAGSVRALPGRRGARHGSAGGHGAGAEDEAEKDQERREWPPSQTVMCLVRHLGLLLALMPMWVGGLRFQPGIDARGTKVDSTVRPARDFLRMCPPFPNGTRAVRPLRAKGRWPRCRLALEPDSRCSDFPSESWRWPRRCWSACRSTICGGCCAGPRPGLADSWASRLGRRG